MNTELVSTLEPTAMLGSFTRPLLVAWVLTGLWLGLARASLPLRRRVIAWAAVAAALTAWLAIVWTLGLHGEFQHASSGLLVGSDLVVIATMLTPLIRSESVTAAIDASPTWWLVASQGYRVFGLVFVRLWMAGILPGSFALPAGIGDALTGIAALGTAFALWRNVWWARALAYGVNIFGIADLLNAVTFGALAAASVTGPSALTAYPLVLVPTFGVPMGLMIHCLSLWQLHRRRHPLRPPQSAAALLS